MPVTTQAQDERRAWLEARKQGIGGSDAATIMGVNPWHSPYALYLEKAGLVDTSDDDNERMLWGRKLEPLIASHYAEVTGRKLAPGANMHFSAERPHLFANTDRTILPFKGRPKAGVYEGKTTSAYNVEEWRDGKVPLYYQVQLQHYCYVEEAEWGSFGVLVGGQQFLWSDASRNDRFLKSYLRKADEFWDRVKNNDPPPMEGHPSERKALGILYGAPDGEKAVDLPEEAHEWMEKLDAAKEAVKTADADKRKYDTLIRGAMGDALFGRLSGVRFGYKLAVEHKKEHTRKASSSRVLRKVKTV